MRQIAWYPLSLPSGVKRFIATETLLGIGIGMMNLFLNLHFLAIGLNPAEIGEVTSAGTIAMAIVSFPSGSLVTKFGRKRMLVFGIVLMALAYAGFGLGHNKPEMMAAQLIWSIGLSFLVTSEIQLLFQYCTDKKTETQAFSLLFAVFTLFTGVGTLIGGFLPSWLGGGTTIYQYSFFAGAAFVALCAFLRGLLLPDVPAAAGQRKSGVKLANVKRGVSEAERDSLSKLLILSVSIFLMGFTFNLATPYFNVILQYRYAWSDEQVSLLLSAVGVSLFIGSLVMPAVLEKLDAKQAFVLLFAINVALTLMLGSSVNSTLFSGVLLVRGGCYTLLNNMIESETMSAVSERDRNRFAGMRSVFRSAGSALAAFLGGAVLEARNTSLPFLLTGMSLMVGWVWFRFFALPWIQKREEKPSGMPAADEM